MGLTAKIELVITNSDCWPAKQAAGRKVRAWSQGFLSPDLGPPASLAGIWRPSQAVSTPVGQGLLQGCLQAQFLFWNEDPWRFSEWCIISQMNWRMRVRAGPGGSHPGVALSLCLGGSLGQAVAGQKLTGSCQVFCANLRPVRGSRMLRSPSSGLWWKNAFSGKEPTCRYRRPKRMRVRSLGQENPLQEEMATHSSILAWRIPWTEDPGGLRPTGCRRVRHDWGKALIKMITILSSSSDLLTVHKGHRYRGSDRRSPIYHGISLSHKKEWNNAICDNMDGPQEYCTKWNQSDRERWMLYNFTYMWNLKRKTEQMSK